MTEIFPVGSLGHRVALPALLAWHFDWHAPGFLAFLAVLHAGTAAALIGYFWRDWVAIAIGLAGFGTAHHRNESRRVFLLIVIATIPAVVLGLAVETFIRGLFATPLVASAFLIVNGLMLMAGERSRARAVRPLSDLGAIDALAIGLWQCLAFVPGLSRTGATMVGGLTRGVDHEDAAHFSFLLAAPVLLAAAVTEAPGLSGAGLAGGSPATGAMAAIVAGAAAWGSAWFLMRYFRCAERSRALDPFGWYSIVAGALLTAWFLFV